MAEIELLDEEPKDYLSLLLKYLNKSTKENSIVIEFDLEENNCNLTITKYDIDGQTEQQEEQIKKTQGELLENIIAPFLKEMSSRNKILINNVSAYKENTSSLKVISENNDMCKINGIDEKNATYLQERMNNKNTPEINQGKIDERGVGNILGFILSMIVFGLIILGMMTSNIWN